MLWRKVSWGVFFLFATLALYAHPHIFINCSIEFVWEKADLKGCYIQWEFDRFFSADIMRGFDNDKNGVFDAEETRAVFQNAFSNLKKYNYFIFIRQGKQRISPTSVSQFSVSQRQGQVIYRFFVDLSRFSKGDLFLAVYDYTFYCEVRYDEKSPVKLTYDPNFIKPTYLIQENREYPVYYDPLSPASDTTIHTTWRRGLMTFYPKEIKISYGS
ncbi:MAG: DUF1007 family protein [Spirochaetales bacterium]